MPDFEDPREDLEAFFLARPPVTHERTWGDYEIPFVEVPLTVSLHPLISPAAKMLYTYYVYQAYLDIVQISPAAVAKSLSWTDRQLTRAAQELHVLGLAQPTKQDEFGTYWTGLAAYTAVVNRWLHLMTGSVYAALVKRKWCPLTKAVLVEVRKECWTAEGSMAELHELDATIYRTRKSSGYPPRKRKRRTKREKPILSLLPDKTNSA